MELAETWRFYAIQLSLALATIVAFGHLHLRIRRLDVLCDQHQHQFEEAGDEQRVRRAAPSLPFNLSRNDLWMQSLSKIKVYGIFNFFKKVEKKTDE